MTDPTEPLQDLQARLAAERRIIAAVSRGESPDREDVEIWKRGGAVFWNEDHWFVAWGLLLGGDIDERDLDEIRTLIEDSGDIWREKFGSIPLKDVSGNEAVAITAFNGFTGDKLFGFFPTIEDFVKRASDHGWLLDQKRDMSDAMSRMTDDQLKDIWSNKSEQPFR